MCYEIKLFQVYSLQSVQQTSDAHTQKFKTLKGCFDTLQPIDKALSSSHSLI